ncbi:hypothetical protein [Paraburkholderia xenovorans]|uniref:hypothetical protein n=1 Tax=Paraburkholderia xenovorans TaxID=36873 RepID=UPI00130DB712|nr:hypothetical protein [Paraburkholderia xenovorans]
MKLKILGSARLGSARLGSARATFDLADAINLGIFILVLANTVNFLRSGRRRIERRPL